MMTPQLYLFFKGDCLQAVTHYADTLGGSVGDVMLNKYAPPENRMPGGDDLVMHLSLRLGDAVIMASDDSAETYKSPRGYRVYIEAPSLSDYDRIFAALSDKAQDMHMPPTETFWAERFAMFTDRFGTPWMLSFTGSKSAGPQA